MVKEELIAEITGRFGPAVISASEAGGEQVLCVRREAFRGLMEGLKSAPFLYVMLLDATCVDYCPDGKGFEMVYHLYSLERNTRLRLKVSLPGENPVIASLARLWKNAEWLEREVFDMFGVRFEGHPYLRRILLYDEFEGHPLRKSYPWRKEQPRIALKDKD
jgi:NADH-quinone oxidoreductase subunit C